MALQKCPIFSYLFLYSVTMFGDARRDPTLIGAFDAKCDLRRVIEDAAESAQYLCEKYYLGSPEVEFEVINGKFLRE